MSSPGNPIRRVVPPSTPENYVKFADGRATKNQPHYLKSLPFYNRYPKTFVIGGSILGFCIVYSAPIYYFFRSPPENEPPEKRLWKGEIERGKTYLEQFRERQQKNKDDQAMALAKQQEFLERKARTKAVVEENKRRTKAIVEERERRTKAIAAEKERAKKAGNQTEGSGTILA